MLANILYNKIITFSEDFHKLLYEPFETILVNAA